MSEIKEAFANGLRQARKMRRWTQHQLAEAAALSVDTVSRLEHGDASPSFESIEALAKALGISALQFFSLKPLESGRSSKRAKALGSSGNRVGKSNGECGLKADRD